MSEELVSTPDDGAALAALTTSSMPRLMELAVQKGLEGVEILERLVGLNERMMDRAAAAAFAEAMAAFKRDCPPVVRRTENAQFSVTHNGMKSVRKYASLEDIEATIRPHLGTSGLAYRWSDTTIDGGSLRMSCVVSHVGGHSISSSATVPIDSKAGCSDQQKMGTAMTYAQRYSLIAALGLTSCDEDNDGNEAPAEVITPNQVDVLEALLEKRPQGAKGRMLLMLNVDRMEQVPASRFEALRAELEAKIKAGK